MNEINWRAKQKMWCYIVIAFVTAFVAQADKITTEQAMKYLAWDWIKFASGCLVPTLITWRAFVDSSIARSDTQVSSGQEQQLETKG